MSYGTHVADSLVDALAPGGVPAFLDTVWGRRAEWASLGTFAGLRLCTANGALEAARSGRLAVKVVSGEWSAGHEETQVRDPATLSSEKCTICVSAIDSCIPELSHCWKRVRERLGVFAHGGVNLYLSSDCQGFGLHFDDSDVIVLQIDGTKEWVYEDSPAVVYPPRNCGLDALSTFKHDFPWLQNVDPGHARRQQRVLDPGMVLYIPAGTWHGTRAGAETYSLSVSMTFSPLRRLDLLREVLTRQWAQDERLRQPLSARAPRCIHARSLVVSEIAEIRRLANASAAMASADDFMRAYFGGLPGAATATEPPSQAGTFDANDQRSFWAFDADDESPLQLVVGGEVLDVPREISEGVLRLITSDGAQITGADAARRWNLPVEDAESVLDELTQRGLLAKRPRECGGTGD